eukprot:jgi/Tetstr1/464902/TSEL_009636.t1
MATSPPPACACFGGAESAIHDVFGVRHLLCKQCFPDVTDKLAEHISGYATQLCHEEMGSSGNYRVVACHEAAAVPDDEDLEGEVTLHPVAEVPQVDPGTLDLRRFTEHLDRADLAEKDPFRRAGYHFWHLVPMVLDIPVDQQRHARQLYGKLWGRSRTVTSLICVDYGYVQQEAAEELLACLVRIEDGIRKRKALEAAAPADRALMAKIQAVANVQDYNRPDNKAKGRRKCSKCGSAGHNRATCPKREPVQENLPPSGPTTGDGAPATSAAACAAP